MAGEFRLDPQDPRFPAIDGLSVELPGRGYGVIDIQRELGEKTPYAPPQPPPAPPDSAAANQAILTAIATLRALTQDWPADRIATFLQSLERQYYRPTHLPPWFEMPFSSGQVIQGESLATAVNAGITTNLVTLAVPNGCYGFINRIGMDTQNDVAGVGRTDWPNLSWDIAIGPTAATAVNVPGYAAMVGQRGQVEEPTSCHVFVPENSVVVLRVTNTSGLAIPGIRGRLDGWFWRRTVRMSMPAANESIVA